MVQETKLNSECLGERERGVWKRERERCGREREAAWERKIFMGGGEREIGREIGSNGVRKGGSEGGRTFSIIFSTSTSFSTFWKRSTGQIDIVSE